MNEEPDGAEVADPIDGDTEAPSQSVVHHGEALVAALLNTQQAVSGPGSPTVTPSTVPPSTVPPSTTPPLTASTVISHTDPASFTPAASTVVGATPGRESDGSDGEDGDADDTPLSQPPLSEASGGDGDDPPQADVDDGDDAEEAPSFTRNLIEWVVVLGAAVIVAILLRTFVFQAFFIPSESMEATLFENDRILVNKVSYRLHDVNRGDVVVFRRPDDQPAEIRDLIKRVIGLPGETVEGRNGNVYINDQLLVEPYLDPDDRFSDFGPVVVPEDELFMMGDNRDQSLDSRRFGTIHTDRVVGRAFFLWYPFGRVGSL